MSWTKGYKRVAAAPSRHRDNFQRLWNTAFEAVPPQHPSENPWPFPGYVNGEFGVAFPLEYLCLSRLKRATKSQSRKKRCQDSFCLVNCYVISGCKYAPYRSLTWGLPTAPASTVSHKVFQKKQLRKFLFFRTGVFVSQFNNLSKMHLLRAVCFFFRKKVQ